MRLFPSILFFLLLANFSAQAQIDSILLASLKEANLANLKKCLKNTKNLNATDDNGANALMWAVFYGDLPSVKYLVEQGATVATSAVIYESKGYYYGNLQGMAAAKGTLPLLSYLVNTLHLPLDENEYNPDSKKNNGWTPVLWAASNGHLDVLKYLVKQGIKIDEPDTANLATPLIAAVEAKKWEMVFQLLDLGAGKKLGHQLTGLRDAATRLSKVNPDTTDINIDIEIRNIVFGLKKAYFQEFDVYYVKALIEHAGFYLDLGDYQKALAIIKEAVEITKKLNNQLEYADCLNKLVLVYSNLSQYEEEQPIVEQVKEIHKKELGEKNGRYASSLHNLATLYTKMGNNRKALELHNQALTIKKELDSQSMDYANSLNSIASIYASMNNFEKARDNFQQALKIMENAGGKEQFDYAISVDNLAVMYGRWEKYQEALPLFTEALSIFKKLNDKVGYAKSLHNLAVLYENMGEFDNALPRLKSALNLRANMLGTDNPDYASSLNVLGILYSRAFKNSDSVDLLIRSANIRLKYLTRAYSSFSEQQKISFINKESTQFQFLPSLLFSPGMSQPAIVKQVYADELVFKGMVLEDFKNVLRSVRESGDTSLLHLYEQWRLYRNFIADKIRLPKEKRVYDVDSLEEASDKVEQRLSRLSAEFRTVKTSQSITAKDIAQKLQQGQAAIEFLRVKYYNVYNLKWTDSVLYAAMVLLPGDTDAKFVPLFEERQLQHLLQPFTNADKQDRMAVISAFYKVYPGIDQYNKNANGTDSLYALIWKPLEKYLEGVKMVYYAPAGLLHQISFQALRADAKQLLIDKYQLNQLLSTRSVALPSRENEKPSSVAVWGNIQYDGSGTASADGATWQPLSASRQEVDSLRKVFNNAGIKPSSVSDTAASEEAFMEMDGKSPAVLHVSTHGFFFQDTASGSLGAVNETAFEVQQNAMFRSGLVLAGANKAWKSGESAPGKKGGVLTAYEIAQLNLSNTDLLVLSACETALGDLDKGNEGVIGLQRAFKIAGVKQMIISLWRVPDKQTAELLTMFYRNWLKDGQPVRAALRSAQLSMKLKHPEPYYWAGFVLVE